MSHPESTEESAPITTELDTLVQSICWKLLVEATSWIILVESKTKITKITKITKDIKDTTIKKKHRSPSQKARSAKFFERKAAERKATAKKKKEESGNSMESLLALITTTGCGKQGFPSAQLYLSHTPASTPKMEQPRQKETPSLQPHAPIVRVATKALADKTCRIASPRCTALTLIADSIRLWILLCCPIYNVTDRYGQWERAAIIDKLDERSPVYLYPLSFVGFALRDTVEVTSTFDRMLRILTPKCRMYMQSLLCHLLGFPAGDSFRLRVEDDLLSFISFYILGDKPLNTKNGECDDDESEEDFQKRVGDAVRKMKSWDWGADDNNYLRIVESVHLADRLLDTALHFVLVPNEQNPPRPT
ncbi:hypothetical protein CNMCM5793_003071 [Aspergillus hiratsukae]|uniref:Uncharacterized protein n=1 Tax=Aspergillus hiratsukae TaxID=1194566 RepID=A0A8H6PDA3_9EURO|nr:hypothetical protein CNMCM5793_003071 [Aspergillus hiratsukae]